MRNAVMSGYSAATVVVEAAYQRGPDPGPARPATADPSCWAESLLAHDWARDYATRPGVTAVANTGELIAAVDPIVQQIPATRDHALEGLPRLVNT